MSWEVKNDATHSLKKKRNENSLEIENPEFCFGKNVGIFSKAVNVKQKEVHVVQNSGDSSSGMFEGSPTDGSKFKIFNTSNYPKICIPNKFWHAYPFSSFCNNIKLACNVQLPCPLSFCILLLLLKNVFKDLSSSEWPTVFTKTSWSRYY